MLCVLLFCRQLAAQIPPELRLGRAGHAFDHLGGIGGQADAAAASGATVIYTGGFGATGYQGLPPQNEFKALFDNVAQYNRHAKQNGIELAVGYLCATSIVKLDAFAKNWTDEFRAQFKTPPAEWRQQDRQGKPLPSWYGGDYQPACMNNPDWRAYQRAMVKYTLETGHDGVFFDNPTVHPQGCYCPHCMEAFKHFLGAKTPIGWKPWLEGTRKTADQFPKEFLQFRASIARDFLADMRDYARSINPHALITCNNSLNDPSVFYSQCRTYAYNIQQMSQAEDYVVVEDMNSQPRTEANGRTFEYGPTYQLLHAVSHRKPIVAVTIAGADYHTPPNLMRLAMAEAAAHGASYLSWPTWPENQRAGMIAAVRPQADFLRRNEGFLNTRARSDVILYLPFQRWTETDQCAASNIAAALTKANIQYKVESEDDFGSYPFMNGFEGRRPVLLVESRAVLGENERRWLPAFEKIGGKVVEAHTLDWLQTLQTAIGRPSITVEGPPNVRAIVHDEAPYSTSVHLYNLNVQRLSSFNDKVTPATNLKFTLVDLSTSKAKSVRLDSADQETSAAPLKFTQSEADGNSLVTFTVPRLDVSAIAVIEH
jgi:hypothetical protein